MKDIVYIMCQTINFIYNLKKKKKIKLTNINLKRFIAENITLSLTFNF